MVKRSLDAHATASKRATPNSCQELGVRSVMIARRDYDASAFDKVSEQTRHLDVVRWHSRDSADCDKVPEGRARPSPIRNQRAPQLPLCLEQVESERRDLRISLVGKSFNSNMKHVMQPSGPFVSDPVSSKLITLDLRAVQNLTQRAHAHQHARRNLSHLLVELAMREYRPLVLEYCTNLQLDWNKATSYPVRLKIKY